MALAPWQLPDFSRLTLRPISHRPRRRRRAARLRRPAKPSAHRHSGRARRLAAEAAALPRLERAAAPGVRAALVEPPRANPACRAEIRPPRRPPAARRSVTCDPAHPAGSQISVFSHPQPERRHQSILLVGAAAAAYDARPVLRGKRPQSSAVREHRRGEGRIPSAAGSGPVGTSNLNRPGYQACGRPGSKRFRNPRQQSR